MGRARFTESLRLDLSGRVAVYPRNGHTLFG